MSLGWLRRDIFQHKLLEIVASSCRRGFGRGKLVREETEQALRGEETVVEKEQAAEEEMGEQVQMLRAQNKLLRHQTLLSSVPKFSGLVENLDTWWTQRFEPTLTALGGMEDEEKAACLPLLLDEPARTKYYSLDAASKVWAQVRASFQALLQSPDHARSQLQALLSVKQQVTESVEEFSRIIDELAKGAAGTGQEAVNNRLIREAFINGLLWEIRRDVLKLEDLDGKTYVRSPASDGKRHPALRS